MRDDCAVIVASCDAYGDVLEHFAALKLKFWPDCPFETLLVTETAPAPSSAFDRVVACGGGTNWAQRLVTALETVSAPYVLMLCDDAEDKVLGCCEKMKDELPLLYDFDLMLGGGHLAGGLVDGEEKQALEARIAAYEHRERQKHPDARLLYAVGDGNHSLATAKACFEELKAQHPDQDFSRHPARYALCELNNIHDPSQVFEPIHRIVKHCDTEKLIRDLSERFDTAEGTPVPWVSGGKNGVLRIPEEGDLLPLALLQRELDRWLTENDGELDYIHGDAALDALEHEQGSVGFRLPAIDKESLFPGILSGGVLPRKTFSMGEAEEKRYYLEARKILP